MCIVSVLVFQCGNKCFYSSVVDAPSFIFPADHLAIACRDSIGIIQQKILAIVENKISETKKRKSQCRNLKATRIVLSAHP